MLEAARAALGARRLVRVCTHCTAVHDLTSICSVSCLYTIASIHVATSMDRCVRVSNANLVG